MLQNKRVYTKRIALRAMQRKTVTMLVAILMLSAIPLNVAADENDDIPTNAMHPLEFMTPWSQHLLTLI